jgi:esterase/lipase
LLRTCAVLTVSVAAAAAVVQSQDKSLRLLNDFWHVLTKEEGNEKIQQQCLQWLQQRTPNA